MAKKNLIVGQSGGPTAVINSSLYGVVSEGLSHPDTIEHVYGMVNGIEGFLNDCILDFEEALPGEDLNGLKSTPGAYLGSCRYPICRCCTPPPHSWRQRAAECCLPGPKATPVRPAISAAGRFPERNGRRFCRRRHWRSYGKTNCMVHRRGRVCPAFSPAKRGKRTSWITPKQRNLSRPG